MSTKLPIFKIYGAFEESTHSLVWSFLPTLTEQSFMLSTSQVDLDGRFFDFTSQILPELELHWNTFMRLPDVEHDYESLQEWVSAILKALYFILSAYNNEIVVYVDARDAKDVNDVHFSDTALPVESSLQVKVLLGAYQNPLWSMLPQLLGLLENVCEFNSITTSCHAFVSGVIFKLGSYLSELECSN